MGMMALTIQTVPRICTAGYEMMVHDCNQTAFDQRQAWSLWLYLVSWCCSDPQGTYVYSYLDLS